MLKTLNSVSKKKSSDAKPQEAEIPRKAKGDQKPGEPAKRQSAGVREAKTKAGPP